ncbi:MAG: electron transfer flavoprotein subunit alpha/FixB family protein, partial [Actinobacteria bacterium]|nr:electron transfer flavoprotein subunit alpha/FixB family protein [Actinomycetota bacterium]
MALNSVWVHAESLNGEVRPSSLELLTKAREIAGEVVAFYAGDDDV